LIGDCLENDKYLTYNVIALLLLINYLNILFFIFMQCSLYKFTKNEVHKKYTLNDFDKIKELTDQIKWKNPGIYVTNGRRQRRLRFTFDTCDIFISTYASPTPVLSGLSFII